MAQPSTQSTSKPGEKPKTNGNGSAPQAVKPPEGYAKAEAQTQVAGYWLPDKGPIHGKLVGAYDFRQKSGRGKGQIRRVYIIDLADPCVARVTSEDGKGKKSFDEDTLKPRELCGIFGSAGLRDLDSLGNTFVFVTPELGEDGKQKVKELESGNVMKLFQIFSKGTPKPLKIREYTEKESQTHGEAAGDDGNDELPF